MENTPNNLLQIVLLFLHIYLRKIRQNRKLSVIDDCTVTFLVYYWSPEASNLRYISFAALIFYPFLKKNATTEGTTVLPDHTKLPAPFQTECDPQLSTFPQEAWSYSWYFMNSLITLCTCYNGINRWKCSNCP